MAEHQWYYLKTGMIDDDVVGPIDEKEFAAEIRAGKIKPKTQIMSPTRTKNGWCPLQKIPACMKVWQQGEDERAELKRREAEEKARQREIATRERSEQRQQVAQQRQAAAEERRLIDGQRRSEAAAISDCPDVALVEKLRKSVEEILTRGESIEYIAVQKKPVNIKPDALVATTRRLIFYQPKLLGRFDFKDYLWRELGDAQLSQGMMGSTFSAKHVSGTVVQMEWLSKESARRFYRIAQEREEEAIEIRRQRQMEEMQAGAAKVAIQTNVGQPDSPNQPALPGQPSGGPPPLPGPSTNSSSTGDLVQRLESLKDMLDKGLITQDDYDAQKREILSKI